MKTIITLLTLFLLLPLSGIAQENSDILLQEGTKWTEGLLDIYVYTYRSEIEYEIRGDSLLEGNIYKKVYANGNFHSLIREDNEKKVYFRYVNPDTKEERDLLLYTFGAWNIGDSISYSRSFLPFPPDFENITIKGVIHKGSITDIRLKDGKDYKIYSNHIINGIGDINQGPFGIMQTLFDNGTDWDLIRFSYKNEILYESERLEMLGSRLVTDGVHWVERRSIENDPDIPDPASNSYELIHFRINGDTILHGKTYKKVYCNDDYYMGLREEDAFNVWRTTENGESLLYTFDWKTPLGRFTNEEGEDFKLPAGSAERTSIAGGEYITCKVPYNPDKSADPFRTHNKDIRLILNIGLTSGIFSHIQPARDCYCFNDLVCFYDGDKLIYQNPVFTETGEVLSIDTPQEEGNLSVLISGNEVIFTLRNLSGNEHTVLNVYTEEGMLAASYSLQNGAVTVNDLPCGIYFYCLDKGKGMSERGKFSINNHH